VWWVAFAGGRGGDLAQEIPLGEVAAVDDGGEFIG
jgi:hypothetical protein